jgi:anti-anti-sigma factor
MKIETDDREIALVVTIRGNVDGTTADTLLNTLHDQVEAGHTRMVADLSGVDYTSSAGLRALLATVKEARRKGGDLRLADVQPNVRKVLDLSGFTSILKLYDDVDAAVESFVESART